MRSAKLTRLSAVGLLAAVVSLAMPANAAHIEIGFLNCKVSGGLGFVFGSSVIGGLASLFGAQAQLSAQTPTSAIFYLWGASACLSGLAFFAAKGVTVKLRQD